MSAPVRYDLEGRTAIVTGGASGIGAATVAALGTAGARVGILDMQPVDGAIACAVADVGDADAVRAAVAELEKATGPCDILVHSAGVPGPFRRALELDEGEWDRVMRINAGGTFRVCRAVVPGMVARGYGRVVLVSSIAGKEGNPLLPAYAASKAAVIALARSLGRDVAGSGVLVNAVAPAVVETPMASDQSPEIQQMMVSAVPMGRMGRPDEAAALITWLSSDACSFSTGAVYDLSGGRSVS
jgi:3-oxoacyl-[acyl-carrier protein] reductase